MGSPSTSKELMQLNNCFERLDQKLNVKFIFVGSPHLNMKLKNLEYRHWSEENVIQDIMDMDIGIMPPSHAAGEKSPRAPSPSECLRIEGRQAASPPPPT